MKEKKHGTAFGKKFKQLPQNNNDSKEENALPMTHIKTSIQENVNIILSWKSL